MGIDEINIEADGYVTREQDLRRTPLERVTDNTANPTAECCYPECEKCRDYVRYEGANYCTVPMVINKQTWRLTADLIADMKREIDEVREMVYDHILGEKTRDESGNYSVEDDFRFLTEEEYEELSPLNKYWYDKAVATHFSVEWGKFIESFGEPKAIRVEMTAPLPKEGDKP